MHLRFFSLLVILGCSTDTVTSLDVEQRSPAVQEGRLAEAVGIETLGGVFTAFLEVGCPIPCEKTQVFSTAADNQTEIAIALSRGTADLAAGNHPLGRFAVVGIPEASRGQPQVAVTLRADAEGIQISARGLEGIPVKLVREQR